MARHRRRRERRDAIEHRPAAPDKRDKRSEDKRRQAFEADQRSLRRRRTFIGALGFIPLVGALGCGAGVQLSCQVPQEWWLAIWAALFGSFLGITIRLFLTRRRFLRGAAGG
ncbi:MAG: hypothetical protein M3T56_02180 [Chloroflexota bacterium]|nr:hypothetical protein [Chloroflexota bacterium]